jgi:RNA polymerase-binding transcription factor
MDPERARQLLTQERERIERTLAALERPAEGDELSHVDQHIADEGSEVQQQETDEGIAERLREALDAIERAEGRLAGGTYGVSIESGEPIPDGRLERIPWAERTADEQARYERGG